MQTSSTSTLASSVATLTHAELHQKLQTLSATVRAHKARRQQLASDLDRAEFARKERERQLLLDGGPLYNDPVLRELQDAAAAAKQRLKAVPEQERELQAVLDALTDEARSREAELLAKATDLARRSWHGVSPEELLSVAIKVAAEACLAYAHSRTTRHQDIDAVGFVNQFIMPDLPKVFTTLAETGLNDARKAIIKQDERLG